MPIGARPPARPLPAAAGGRPRSQKRCERAAHCGSDARRAARAVTGAFGRPRGRLARRAVHAAGAAC